ncbi:hypothetical protein [Zoogloea sp.]|uniref:hypothetical protein n=1 Tax=Zoogloea sp. TaxID=49181 RepID=UPI001D39B84B|nr:hypothetical protein [Zoogloea sp.]MBK6652389.1 hypothetical protein [Zoogloea sp.]
MLDDCINKGVADALAVLKVKASWDISLPGFGPGEYEVEAWLVGEQDGGGGSDRPAWRWRGLSRQPRPRPRPSNWLRARSSPCAVKRSKRARLVQGEAAKADGTRNVLTP